MIGDTADDGVAPGGGRAGASRVSTGVRELDQILGGGFPRNSINILMGHPGTGKTILAEQLLFCNVGDRPVLYLTTLSEPLAKIVSYLQQFAFYDDARMVDSVVYDDIGESLADNGPDVLLDHIRDAIRDIGPSIIVVDSFKAIHDLTDSIGQMRRLVSELAGILTAYETTTFLVGEYSESQVPELPEFAVADSIVELARRSTAKRDERFLRVLKLRGSSYAEGFHAISLSDQGLHVFPRLVTPRIAPDYRTIRERIPSGIDGMDALMNGGLWRGSPTLLKGQAGSGKTTIGLQFAIQGVRDGEASLYVNFQENPGQLGRTIEALNEDPDELAERGLILRYVSPVEMAIDHFVVDIFAQIEKHDVKRVVIDALGDIITASNDPQRFHDYLYSLSQHFITRGVSALYVLEAPPYSSPAYVQEEARFSSMVDTMIELDIDLGALPRRTLRVVKARGTAHDMRLHEMTIRKGGVVLGEPIDPT